MQYIKFQLVPTEEALHPIDRILRDDENISREAIHHLRLLNDDSVVGLYELKGEIAHLRSTFEHHGHMHDYTISRSGDSIYAHAHTEANEMLRGLLRIQDEYDIVIETPIEYTSQGGFRVTSVGTLETLRRTIPLIPDTVDVVFENTGNYVPKRQRPFTRLTERQRATVRVAVAEGYYEHPRQCTYGDIADAMGLSPETVGEHLRKAEAKLVHDALP